MAGGVFNPLLKQNSAPRRQDRFIPLSRRRKNGVHIRMLKRCASQTARPVISSGVPGCGAVQGNQFWPGQSREISLIGATAYCRENSPFSRKSKYFA